MYTSNYNRYLGTEDNQQRSGAWTYSVDNDKSFDALMDHNYSKGIGLVLHVTERNVVEHQCSGSPDIVSDRVIGKNPDNSEIILGDVNDCMENLNQPVQESNNVIAVEGISSGPDSSSVIVMQDISSGQDSNNVILVQDISSGQDSKNVIAVESISSDQDSKNAIVMEGITSGQDSYNDNVEDSHKGCIGQSNFLSVNKEEIRPMYLLKNRSEFETKDNTGSIEKLAGKNCVLQASQKYISGKKSGAVQSRQKQTLRSKLKLSGSKGNDIKKKKLSRSKGRGIKGKNRYSKLKQLSCTDCDFESTNKEGLLDHVKKVHPPKLHRCVVCGEIFMRVAHLIEHCKVNHSNNKKCGICGKEYKFWKRLLDHVPKHQDLNYRVGDHDGRYRYRCSVCTKTFSRQGAIDCHMLTEHLEKIIPTRYSQTNVSLSDTEGTIKNTCVNSEEGKSFGKLQTSTGADCFQCKLCPKSFTKRPRFVKHMKSQHCGIKSCFLCFICGKTFTLKESLNGHLNIIHKGIRPDRSCICEICGKSLSSSRCLRQHKRYFHDENLKFKCDSCDSSFKRKKDLGEHKKWKHGNRACEMCGKKFSSAWNLKAHRKTHQGLKPMYSYLCKLCQNRYATPCSIRRHMICVHKIHKDKKCWREDICKIENNIETVSGKDF